MKHKWKWSTHHELHYDSLGDYYRRNISAWFLPAIFLGPIMVFLYVDLVLIHQWWWALYWLALIALNATTVLWPRRTYKSVIVPHREKDREFISNLENQGVPVGVAQEILAALEDHTVTPGMAVHNATQMVAEWHVRKRLNGFDT